MTDATDPQQVAEACAREMYRNDRAAQALGIELDWVACGQAQMHMRVRPDMINTHETCHGGLIFTLADTAFAYACNSRNHVTVAASANIAFVNPARLGDLLVAEARELTPSRRTGVYDISVHRDDGTLIALFRGHSHRIRGRVVHDLETPE